MRYAVSRGIRSQETRKRLGKFQKELRSFGARAIFHSVVRLASVTQDKSHRKSKDRSPTGWPVNESEGG